MIVSDPILDQSHFDPIADILGAIAALEELEASMIRQGMAEASESISTVIRDLQWQVEQLS